MKSWEELGVRPCDILVPQKGRDYFAYSVVACDQFTSDTNYWKNVEQTAGERLSTLNMIFPEIYLGKNDDARIAQINVNMNKALDEGEFQTLENSIMYIERTLDGGKVRRGLVLAFDLEKYDYSKNSHSLIRATEGTIEDRLPPRIKIRKDAPLEFPHIMILINDAQKHVIEPLADMPKSLVYDTPLMLGGGSIKGWRLEGAAEEHVRVALDGIDCGEGENVIRFAMGDGNHSLATAKKCWEQLKQTLTKEQAKSHPARFALCELVNLHDDSLVFEPIHRVLFNVDRQDFLSKMHEKLFTGEKLQSFTVSTDTQAEFAVGKKLHTLAVGTLQIFIDEYLASHPEVRIDYIHEAEKVIELSRNERNIGFIVPSIDKSELFPAVRENGALPRKTFSMGRGQDKRYYMEARKIR